ncbi:DUF2066 domain-containing protein [Lysobacter korlensis]|uniref:DUF2066 domain-containing protein n=1 Tax=Lysobacter korlensis TaxID=553636 RepID=A0ABV6RP97_9GAMM
MPFVTRARRWIWVAMLVMASFGAAAQRVEGDRAKAEGAYAAEITVTNQAPAQRNAAFTRGLVEVLTKITGDRTVTSKPGVGQELRKAGEYVKGHDYRQDEGVSASGAPSFRTVLVVRYDEEKIEALVDTLGLPVWPQPRAKPVLWLAIDDGSGPRLVGLQGAAAARSVLDRAIERGYRLGLPAGTAAEQALVAAIWRGDTAAIARASQRYAPPMQLIGKLYRDGKGGWTADWIMVDNGKVLSQWSKTERDARRAMASGADGAADALVKKYAKPREGAGPAGEYTVTFTGLRSGDDYIRLMGYLQKQAVVRRIVPVTASPDRLVLQLELVSGVEGFKRATAKDGVLAADEGDEPAFRLR